MACLSVKVVVWCARLKVGACRNARNWMGCVASLLSEADPVEILNRCRTW